jgi:hypothetical protein
VAWFTPNETEAAFYVGEEKNARTAAKRLHRKRAARRGAEARR